MERWDEVIKHRLMENDKFYEVTFGFGYPLKIREKVRIVGEPNKDIKYNMVSYPSIIITDKGYTWGSYFAEHTIIEVRELFGGELNELETLYKFIRNK